MKLSDIRFGALQKSDVTCRVARKEAPTESCGSMIVKRNKETEMMELTEAPGDKAIKGQTNILEFNDGHSK